MAAEACVRTQDPAPVDENALMNGDRDLQLPCSICGSRRHARVSCSKERIRFFPGVGGRASGDVTSEVNLERELTLPEAFGELRRMGVEEEEEG